MGDILDSVFKELHAVKVTTGLGTLLEYEYYQIISLPLIPEDSQLCI